MQTSSPIETKTSSLYWFFALLGALLLLAGFRILVLKLTSTNLYFDESQYWFWSQTPAFGYFSKPPMLAWLIGSVTTLCGSSAEFCVRLGSPITHTLTALAIFGIGTSLYDGRIGFWSGLAYATIPAVSLSSGLISTDVPLLFFWALALLSLVQLFKTRHWSWALGLGLFIGLGLMSKYAMLFFVISLFIYFIQEDDDRWLLRSPLLILVGVVAAALFLPNILWNQAHSFATVAHTADNANWGRELFHPLKMLEFIGAQFGVFGPILFGALLIILFRDFSRPLAREDRLLLYFAIPVLLIVATQALMSRAHANWAATAYVAASVLVIKTMLADQAKTAFRVSFILNGLFVLIIGIGLATAKPHQLGLGRLDPFIRLFGWQEMATATQKKLGESGLKAILSDGRNLSANLNYYLRNSNVPIKAWMAKGATPHDHYQLKTPYTGQIEGPLLLVSLKENPDRLIEDFADITPLGHHALSAGRYKKLWFFKVSGYKPKEGTKARANDSAKDSSEDIKGK